jgi:hypothetical protein
MPFGVTLPSASDPDASAVTIEETVGRSGASPRSLVLRGGALPAWGASWGFQWEGLKTTWYAGNAAEGTQQVLVPAELPSSWQGEWLSGMLASAGGTYTDEQGGLTFLGEPDDLRVAFETLGRSGILLRVTWSTVLGGREVKIVREGRCARFEYKPRNAAEYEWSASFEWVSRGRAQAKTVATRENAATASLGAATNAVNASLATIDQTKKKGALTLHAPSSLTLGQLESLALAPLALVSSLKAKLTRILSTVQQVTQLVSTVRNIPQSIENTAKDFAQDAVNTTRDFEDALTSTPPEAMSQSSRTRDVVRAANYFSQVLESTRAVQRTALDTRDALRNVRTTPTTTSRQHGREAQASDILAVHVTKDGETSSGLSSRYYGDPDHAVDILRANHLPWHQVTLPRGRSLIIPRVASAARG